MGCSPFSRSGIFGGLLLGFRVQVSLRFADAMCLKKIPLGASRPRGGGKHNREVETICLVVHGAR